MWRDMASYSEELARPYMGEGRVEVTLSLTLTLTRSLTLTLKRKSSEVDRILVSSEACDLGSPSSLRSG